MAEVPERLTPKFRSRDDGDSLDLDRPGDGVAVRDERFDIDPDRLADHRQGLLAGFALARAAGTATLNPPSPSGVSTTSYLREVDIGSAYAWAISVADVRNETATSNFGRSFAHVRRAMVEALGLGREAEAALLGSDFEAPRAAE